MTENKSLKRRVRSRMAKTGERYTSARRQVLAKGPESESANTSGTPQQPESATIDPHRPADDVAVARTGRTTDEWFALLDAWGAADRPHPNIVRWLTGEHDVDGWWAQSLTVSYEQAIGRRAPGQRPDGFAASVTRTFGVPLDVLFDAFADESMRSRWLADAPVRLRGATAGKTVRFDWLDDGSRVVAGFGSKGEGRSLVGIEHLRLADRASAERLKAFWRARLEQLRGLLEA